MERKNEPNKVHLDNDANLIYSTEVETNQAINGFGRLDRLAVLGAPGGLILEMTRNRIFFEVSTI